MSRRQGRNPVLSKRLAAALLLTLLAVLILATIAAAVSAYLESSHNQDETLLSVAHLVQSNQVEMRYDPAFFRSDEYDDGVRVWEIAGNRQHGFEIKASTEEGFHTLGARGKLWRVLVIKNAESGKRHAIVQKLSVSTEIATRSAFNTAIPLLFLFLLIPVLVTLTVRHSFKPLNRLTQKLGTTDSLQLDVSNKQEIPFEVLPFVSAIDSLLHKNAAYNQRQRRFIADAAHELRTPITALSLELENVRSASSEEALAARQTSLTNSIQRLQRLVNQLLDLARAQSADATSSTEVSLNDLVRTQIADLYVLAEARQLDISVERNDPVQVVDTNHQLQHLIRNALSNAIKFTPERGEIRIRIERQSDAAVFTVEDNGPGVSVDDLDRLHEPFYRPDGQASGTGAGLGLAICHEIAASLDGHLSLSNLEPTGFRFRYSQASL